MGERCMTFFSICEGTSGGAVLMMVYSMRMLVRIASVFQYRLCNTYAYFVLSQVFLVLIISSSYL